MRFTELRSDFHSWQCTASFSKTRSWYLVDFPVGHFQTSSSLARPRLTLLHLISEPERAFEWPAFAEVRDSESFVHVFFVNFEADSYVEFICELVSRYSKCLVRGIMWKNRKFVHKFVAFLIFAMGCPLVICSTVLNLL